jgi:hypothetical protein
MEKPWPWLFGAMLAFALATGCWAFWGLITPGDFFANGSPLLYPSLLAALVIGAWAGFNTHNLWLRALIVAVLLAAVCFHVFAPLGWWVKSPPGGGPHGG